MSAVPISVPRTTESPRLRVVARRRAHSRAVAFRRALAFSLIASVTFMASSLAGNVMLEKARQEGKQAMRRTLAAREYQSTLQRQVIRLHSSNSIAGWASANGFIASDVLSHPSTGDRRVALNR